MQLNFNTICFDEQFRSNDYSVILDTYTYLFTNKICFWIITWDTSKHELDISNFKQPWQSALVHIVWRIKDEWNPQSNNDRRLLQKAIPLYNIF